MGVEGDHGIPELRECSVLAMAPHGNVDQVAYNPVLIEAASLLIIQLVTRLD